MVFLINLFYLILHYLRKQSINDNQLKIITQFPFIDDSNLGSPLHELENLICILTVVLHTNNST